MSLKKKAALFIQACGAIFLILGLALHIAEVGLIGLAVIVLLTALNGVTEEHRIGHAFEEALAVYRSSGCILRNCCSYSLPAPLFTDHLICTRSGRKGSAGSVLYCQRRTLHDFG